MDLRKLYELQLEGKSFKEAAKEFDYNTQYLKECFDKSDFAELLKKHKVLKMDFKIILEEKKNHPSFRKTIEFLHKNKRFYSNYSINYIERQFSLSKIVKKEVMDRQKEFKIVIEEFKKNDLFLFDTVKDLYKKGVIGKNIKLKSFYTHILGSKIWKKEGFKKSRVKVKNEVEVKIKTKPPVLNKYKKIVEEFEKNNFEGRIMTREVRNAYKVLGKKL